MIKKRMLYIILLGLLILIGCHHNEAMSHQTTESEFSSNTESESYLDDTEQYKLVAFKNNGNGVYNDSWLPIYSEYDVSENHEQLYAFSLSIMAYNNFPEEYLSEEGYDLKISIDTYEGLSEIMEGYGLITFPQCSYYYFNDDRTEFQWKTGSSVCVVAGTREQILKVFSEERYFPSGDIEMPNKGAFIFGDYAVIVSDAMRLDYVDILEGIGWDPNQETKYEFAQKNRSNIKEIIGNDAVYYLQISVDE